MSARKARRRGGGPPRGRADTGRRLGRRWWAVAFAVAVVAVAAWVALGPGGQVGSGGGGLPGPIGGSNVAQDVGTLVGQPALGFTLSDSGGRSHTVTPGGGKPLVLVFHMGIV